MKKTISSTIYFFIAVLLVMDGFIVKYFFTDIDLGARFKNFNHQLLVSNIILGYALFIAIIGLLFYAIRKIKNQT